MVVIKVTCPETKHVFDWRWGRQKLKCPYCRKEHNISEVKVVGSDILKLFR